MSEFKSDFLRTLKERGFIHQVSDESGLDDLLARAVKLGVFGTKMRSVIKSANREGIAAVVKQQFEVAEQIIGHRSAHYAGGGTRDELRIAEGAPLRHRPLPGGEEVVIDAVDFGVVLGRTDHGCH